MSVPERDPTAGEAPSVEPPYGVPPPGFQLPPGTRLGRVRLQVADLDRSFDYYERVLGFDVLDRSAGSARFAARGDRIPLVELVERAGAAPRTTGRLGLYHFAVLVPTRGDLARFLRHLRELGERAGASDHRVSEAIYLRDPDGLGIEVYADRPRSAWEAAGRELRIDTSPLEVPDLLREAGDSPWDGMPAGSVVGHVHLQVGDLADASAFYHEALGLDRMTWSYPGALFLAAGGYHHHLGLNTWAGPDAPSPDDDEARLLEWELVVPSREALDGAGASLERAGHAVEHDASGWSASDPWGTPLRVRLPNDRAAP